MFGRFQSNLSQLHELGNKVAAQALTQGSIFGGRSDASSSKPSGPPPGSSRPPSVTAPPHDVGGTTEVERLRRQVADLQSQLDALAADHTAAGVAAAAEVAQLRGELEAERVKVQLASAAGDPTAFQNLIPKVMRDLERQVASLHEQLGAKEAALVQLRGAQAQVSAQVKLLTEARDAALAATAAARADAAATAQSIEDEQARARMLSSQLQALQVQLHAKAAGSTAPEVPAGKERTSGSADERLAATEKALAAAQARVSELEARLAEVTADLDAARAAATQSSAAQADRSPGDSTDAPAGDAQQAALLAGQLDALHDELAAELRRRRNAEAAAEVAQQRCAAVTAEAATANERAAAAEARVTELTAAAVQSDAAAARVRKLEAQLQEAEAATTRGILKLQELERSLARVEQQRAETAAELNVTQRKLQSTIERNVELSEGAHYAEQVVRKFAELEEEMLANREEARTAQERITAAIDERDAAVAARAAAEAALAEERERLASLQVHVSQLEAIMPGLSAGPDGYPAAGTTAPPGGGDDANQPCAEAPPAVDGEETPLPAPEARQLRAQVSSLEQRLRRAEAANRALGDQLLIIGPPPGTPTDGAGGSAAANGRGAAGGGGVGGPLEQQLSSEVEVQQLMLELTQQLQAAEENLDQAYAQLQMKQGDLDRMAADLEQAYAELEARQAQGEAVARAQQVADAGGVAALRDGVVALEACARRVAGLLLPGVPEEQQLGPDDGASAAALAARLRAVEATLDAVHEALARVQAAAAEAAHEHESEAETLRNAARDAAAHAEGCAERAAGLEATLATLQAQVLDQEGKEQEAAAGAAAAVAEAGRLQQQLDDLSQQLQAAQKARDAAATEAAALRQLANEAAEAATVTQADLTAARSALAAAEAEAASLTAARAAVSAEVEALKAQVEAAAGTEAALREGLASVQAALSAAETDASTLKAARDAAVAGLAGLRQQLEDGTSVESILRDDVARAHAAVAAAEAAAAALKVELETKAGVEAALNTQLSAARDALAAAEHELAALKPELAAAQQQAADAEALSAASAAAATRATADADVARAQLADTTAEVEGLRIELASARQAAAAAEAGQADLAATLEGARAAVSAPVPPAVSATSEEPEEKVTSEHTQLIRQMFQCARVLAGAMKSTRASHNSVADLVASLEAVALDLEGAVAAAAGAIDKGSATPSELRQGAELPAAWADEMDSVSLTDGTGGGGGGGELGGPGAASSGAAAALAAAEAVGYSTLLSAAPSTPPPPPPPPALDETYWRRRVADLETALSKAEDALAVAQAEAQGVPSKDDLAQERAAHRAQLDALQANIEKLASSQHKQFARFESEQQRQVDDLIRSHESAVAKLKAELAASDKAKQDAQRRADGLASDLTAAKEHAATAEAEAKERLDRLQKLVKKRAAEVDDLTAKLATLQPKLAAAEAAANEGKQQVARLTTTVAELRPLEKERPALEARATAAEGRAASAAQDLAAANVKIKALEGEVASLSAEVARLLRVQEQKVKADAQVKELRNLVQDLQSNADDVAAYRAAAEAAEAARNRALSEAARAQNMLHNLEDRLSQVEEDNERLSAALDEQQLRLAAQAALPVASNRTAPRGGQDSSTPAGTAAAPGSLRGGLQAPHRSTSLALLDAPLAVQLLSRTNGPHGGSFFRTLEAHLAALPRKEWLPWLQARALEEGDAAAADGAARGSEEDGAEGIARGHPSTPDLPTAATPRAPSSDSIGALRDRMKASEQRAEALERQVADVRNRAAATEQVLRQELANMAEAHRLATTALRGQLSSAEDEAAVAGAAADAARAQVEALQEELAHVRDRSRALLEERERAYDKLKSELRYARGPKPGTTDSRPAGEGGSGRRSPMGSDAHAAGGSARSEITPVNASAPASQDAAGTRGGKEVAEVSRLRQQLAEYKKAYEDSEATHSLRQQTESALKAEVASLKAMHQVSSQDVTYLRHVLVDAFATGLLPKDSKIFNVVSSVLKLSSQEMEMIRASKPTGGGGMGMITGLFSAAGSTSSSSHNQQTSTRR